MISQPLRPFALKLVLVGVFIAGLGSAGQAALPQRPAEIADVPVALLVDYGSGQVLDQRQADRRFLPASMTKVMTAYVAFEEMKAGRLDPGRTFSVAPQTARQWNGRGTSMYLQANDRVTTHQLLRGLMTASANDAAVVLAQGYAGSVPAWTFLMNDAARRLGMTNSHFATPNGWTDEGRTFVSARDMVILASAMIRHFPDYYHAYAGKKEFAWKRVTLRSHDPVTGVVNGADGIKTGHTNEAGYNFLGSAKRGARRLVMVVGGAKTSRQRELASRAYLEWGFAQWQARSLFGAGRTIARARVQGGAARHVDLVAHAPVYATIPRGKDAAITLKVRYLGPLKAPIRKDQRVAELDINVAGMEPGRIPLYAASAVKPARGMDRLINGFMNLFS